MLKAVFFDLDGTLLPMNEEQFIQTYFYLLYKHIAFLGYEKESLIKTIWGGTKAMYKNDGTKTNEEVFWDYFVSVYGENSRNHLPYFDEFYRTDFLKVRDIAKENPLAKKIVDFVNKNVPLCILSTNPVFPRVGTLGRMGFVNLKEEDFDFITTYDNSSLCKPNPMYFKWLMDKYSLNPDEVILFGNNTYEDGDCASSLGIKTYLVGDFIIHHPSSKGSYEEISMDQVIPVIQKEMELRK